MPVQILRSIRSTSLRRLLTALLLAAVALPASAVTADAGQYRVYVCRMPDGTPLPAMPREMTASPSLAGAVAFEDCSLGRAVQLNWGSPGAPVEYVWGNEISWRFQAPGRVMSFDMRGVGRTTTSEGDWNSTPQIFVAGTSADIETCAAFSGCQFGNWDAGYSPTNDHSYNLGGAGGQSVRIGIRCSGQFAGIGSCRNNGDERVQVVIWKLEFVIEDATPPNVDDRTGTALGEGIKRGTVSVNYTANDIKSSTFGIEQAGSGIYQSLVTIDGREFSRTVPDKNGGACADAGARNGDDLEFLTARPCPGRLQTSVPIDTTRIADGEHDLEVSVRDAGGNISTVYSGRIKIDNVPPPVSKARPVLTGENLTSLRPSDVIGFRAGLWDGSGLKFVRRWQRTSPDGTSWADIPNATGDRYSVQLGDVGRQLRLSETATNSDGTTTVYSDATELVKSGAIVAGVPTDPNAPDAGNGLGGNPSTAQLVVDREQRTVDVKHGAKIVITGRLVDADSQPIADAQVDVFEQLAVTAAPWKKIGSVKTDSQGGYLYRPRTTASRRLRFAYSDRRDAADYRATREVFVSVTAGMSVKAQRKVLNRRGVIRLKGRVVLDTLPASGVWVEVQVLDSGVWRTVATRRTSRTGLWTFRHRLRQSAGITFKFRGRLKVAGDVPSADAKSAPVKVRVR